MWWCTSTRTRREEMGKTIITGRWILQALYRGKKMSLCNCKDFFHLEHDRKQISKRIRESKELFKKLTVLYKKRFIEYELYQCPVCNQMWQCSRAWVSGNEKYLFRVPPISLEEWLEEPYASPDEWLDYNIEAVKRDVGIGIVLGLFKKKLKPPIGRNFPPYHEATKEEKKELRQWAKDTFLK